MRLQFSKKLIHLLSKCRIGAIAVACDMDAIREVFPLGDEAGLARRTYTLCVKQLMSDIARVMREHFSPDDHVLLVHDSGNWNAQALRGYNLLINDPEWEPRGLFDGLLPRSGKQSVGLQAADMIAYEVFKGVKARTNSPDSALRGVIQELRNKRIPMSARWINLEAAKELYRVMKASGKYPDLDDGGVT